MNKTLHGKFLVITKDGKTHICRSIELYPVNGGWLCLQAFEYPESHNDPQDPTRSLSIPFTNIEGVWEVK
jgi:hypothetical protein